MDRPCYVSFQLTLTLCHILAVKKRLFFQLDIAFSGVRKEPLFWNCPYYILTYCTTCLTWNFCHTWILRHRSKHWVRPLWKWHLIKDRALFLLTSEHTRPIRFSCDDTPCNPVSRKGPNLFATTSSNRYLGRLCQSIQADMKRYLGLYVRGEKIWQA